MPTPPQIVTPDTSTLWLEHLKLCCEALGQRKDLENPLKIIASGQPIFKSIHHKLSELPPEDWRTEMAGMSQTVYDQLSNQTQPQLKAFSPVWKALTGEQGPMQPQPLGLSLIETLTLATTSSNLFDLLSKKNQPEQISFDDVRDKLLSTLRPLPEQSLEHGVIQHALKALALKTDTSTLANPPTVSTSRPSRG